MSLGLGNISFQQLNSLPIPELSLNVFSSLYTPVDNATNFFLSVPTTPQANYDSVKVSMMDDIIVTGIHVNTFATTVGTAEAWNLFLRVGNATDHLIQTVAIANSTRIFENLVMNVAIPAGTTFALKFVNPTWVTNPNSVIVQGYIRYTNQ
jgi:hypothetical protein